MQEMIMENKPLILGHRGYRSRFPENTILSFAKASEYGADGIECDIQKTRDGRYIVFHDEDLQRMTGREELVGSADFSDLSKLDIGMGERIPEINSFLDSLRGHRLKNIELKVETIVKDDFPAINSALEHSGFRTSILVSSFKHELLPAYSHAGYNIGLLFSTETMENGISRALGEVLKYRPFSVNLPIDVFCGHVSAGAKFFLKVMKVLGIKIVYWTVNTEEQFNAVKDHAYAIITDNIELMVSLRNRE